MNKEQLNIKYGHRQCICGEELIPRKKLFKNVIIYKCQRSNIFNKKYHSISRAFFVQAKKAKIKLTNNLIK